MLKLWCMPAKPVSKLVSDSYDTIASGYDDAWTSHMRDLSLEMLGRVEVRSDSRCLDLTCGTGFLTSCLAQKSGIRPIGVDASGGMLDVARSKHGDECDYVQSDILEYLWGLEPGSVDVITCGWGLGYSKPMAVLRQIRRVLAGGGQVAIIDNSMFSLAEVLWCSVLTFAERPHALQHVMKARFLPWSRLLAGMMRLSGLRVQKHWQGRRSYHVADGVSAIDRLTRTGAAAGFEYAVSDEDRQDVYARFAEIIENRYRETQGVRITHRYIAAVGTKA